VTTVAIRESIVFDGKAPASHEKCLMRLSPATFCHSPALARLVESFARPSPGPAGLAQTIFHRPPATASHEKCTPRFVESSASLSPAPAEPSPSTFCRSPASASHEKCPASRVESAASLAPGFWGHSPAPPSLAGPFSPQLEPVSAGFSSLSWPGQGTTAVASIAIFARSSIREVTTTATTIMPPWSMISSHPARTARCVEPFPGAVVIDTGSSLMPHKRSRP
jgi:hypothetical protein